MKRISKLLVTLVFAVCVVFSCTSAVSAAGLAKVTGLKVSSYTVSSVKLSWTAVSSAKKYQVRVYEGSTLKNTITTSDSSTSYTVTGLTAKKTYKFSVRAYNSTLVNGSYSSTVSATTGVAKVTNLKATTTATTVKLTWTKVAGATGYIVQQKSGDEWKTLSKPTSNSYTVKDLTPNKKVNFRICAYTKANSKTYKSSYVTVEATPKVPAVSSLKVSSYTCSTVKLSWDKVSGATGYVLQQKKGDTWKTIAKPTSNSYTVKDLTPKTKVNFRVCAYTKVGKKTYMGSYTTISATPKVDAVSTFTSSTSYASATLTWSAVTGAKGYEIQYATKSDYSGAKSVKVTDTSNLTYKLSSLKTGTTYYLRVRAYQTAKVSGKTKTYYGSWKTLTITPVLGSASGLKSSSVSTTSAALSWTKVSGASGYQIVYATSSDFKTNKKTATVSSGSTVTSTLSSLSTGTKYYVKVRAYRTVDSNKVYGGYSSTVNFVTAPAQVTGLKSASVADNSIQIKWTATTASKYLVYYKASSAKSYSSATVTTNSYTLSSLDSASTYNFYVIAVNSAGTKGKASSVLSLTTTGVAKTTPTLSISSVTATGAKATWTKVTGATGYELQYSTNKNLKDAKTVTVKSGSTLTATVSGLDSYTTYYFQVRAYGVSSDKSTVYGTYSSTQSAKTLHTKVTGLKATGGKKSITLTWDKLSYPSYNVYYKESSASSYSKVNTTTNSYTLTNLDGSKTYSIYVKAVTKDSSEGEASSTVTVTTSGISMDKPTLKLTYSDKTPTTATVNWTAVPGATHYRIYRSYKTNAETLSKPSDDVDVKQTSFTYTDLENGYEYTVYVQAIIKDETGLVREYGSVSNDVSFAIKPDAVENLKAVSGETSISLSWNSTPCYTYYVTYTPAGGKATTFKTQSTKFVLTGLKEETTYSISVAAANSKDVKGTAATIDAVSTYKGIDKVNLAQDGKITINSNRIDGAGAYIVQQFSVSENKWIDNLSFTYKDEEDESIITFTNSDCLDYASKNSSLFRIIVYKNSELFFVSDPYKETITAEGFTATADASKYTVTLSWTDDVAAASKVRVYNIYGSSYTEVTASANDTFTYYVAPGAIHRFAVYSDGVLVYSVAVEMPAINTSLTTNESKNAQINYLVQAINNTKNDTTDYVVKAVSGGNLTYDTTYLKMNITADNKGLALAVNLALSLSGITEDFDLLTLSSSLTCNSAEEIEEKLGNFGLSDGDGSGFSNVTEEFKVTSKTFLSSASKTKYIEPIGENASWQYSQTPANWSKAFSSVSTTKQSDGTYKVVATLKKENTTSGYHASFLSKDSLDGSSSIDLNDLFKDSNGKGEFNVKSVGATTLTAIIDSNNHIVSYNITLPSIIDINMELPFELVEIEGASGSIIIGVDMTLDCTTNYEYSFIEM